MRRLVDQLEKLYHGIDRHLRGWPTLFVRTGLAFVQDDGPAVSRSIAFYALFSLFPLVLVLISILSAVVPVDKAQQAITELLQRTLPTAASLTQKEIGQVLAQRNAVSVIALLGLLWSASGVFTAIYRAVNRAWGDPKSSLFLKGRLFGLAVVFAASLILLGTSLLSTAVSLLRQWNGTILGWQPFSDPNIAALWGKLSAGLSSVVSILAFITLYRLIPLGRVVWRDVWLGGLLAGLIWDLARRLYAWYLANVATYSLVYGSVGAIIGFLLWAYLGAMILLIGAEFTAQHTAWRRAGRPIESRPISQWVNSWTK
jgi:membrane protein